MLKHKIIFVTLFSCFLAVNISTVLAMPVDSGTHWLIVDATPDAQADPLLTRLSEVLVERGKVPRTQIHHRQGGTGNSRGNPRRVHRHPERIC